MWRVVSDCRWNIRVTKEDRKRLNELVAARAASTHEFVSDTGTIRRAVYELWERECGNCADI